MAQTTYQVILSSDGKNTVLVTSDDPAAIKVASGWAQATYDRLVSRYGLKHEQYQRNSQQGNGQQQGEEVAPVCAIHQVALAKVQGKRGEFWSCHEKDEKGEWCAYRPKGQ